MANKEVEFHEAASEEFEAAFDWYLERSAGAAVRLASEVSRTIASIAKAPQRWPVGIHGARKFLLRRFPFAVVYRELPTVIQVVAVAHGHRRPGYWKDRG